MSQSWSINGRFLTQPGTGVQRYAHEIVRALDSLLAEQPGPPVELLAPPGAELPFSLEAIGFRHVGPGGGHLWEQTVLPRHARGGLLSLCNTGPVGHRRQIVCIHDANTRVCPESYAPAFRAVYRLLMPALGRSALAVTTVSRHSASDLVRLGICPAGKLEVIPNGHEHALRWQPGHSAATRAAAGQDAVVLIGSPAPHKNTEMILRLAPRLEAAGLRVLVVGSTDPRVFRGAPAAASAANVAWLGRLSDGELAALLGDCLCLAFPSFTEGFGLPPLEAMALGCPVVTSDRASMPEVCAEAALFAAPDDPDAWLRQLTLVANAPELRASLVERGRERAAAYIWSDSARLYLAAMRGSGREAGELAA